MTNPMRAGAGLAIAAGGAALAVAAVGINASGQSAPAAVSAYPLPGTLSASPTTQLSFRGVPADRLGTIDVRGSRSGRHTGRLRAHSDGRGVSWIPSRRFRPGERVTVRTGLPVRAAREGDFRFRVARIPHRVTINRVLLEDLAPGKRKRFRSRPDLAPPVVTVNPNPKPTATGLVFLSPKAKNDTMQAGPMIVDNRGRLVYFRPLPGIRAATDFRAQTYKGRPVVTYWEGTSRQGIGVGDLVVLDQSYKEIARIKAPNGFRPDLHEFVITPNDTALLIAYPSVRTDLQRVGGLQGGVAVDSVLQEIDLETGLVVFEWHSLGRIALRESYSKPTRSRNVPFDYAHFNSVNLDSDGDFLVSARNTWAVYKIDRETGAILWRLGGKRSSFKLGRGVRFAWQHDAQRHADGALTLFDNSAFPAVRKRSRALAIRLDERARTARLERAWIHPRRLLAATQGNHQNLPNGNVLVGWGSQRWLTEYDPSGNVLWDARVALGYESYRAYRMPWVGRPSTRPRVAAVRRKSGIDVFASWNGATEVRSWQVLAGPSADRLQAVADGGRTGFETRIRIPAGARWVAASARDGAGRVLATSPPRRVSGG